MFKRFIHYYKPYKKIFILDMLASLSVAIIAIVYPIITREMLNNLIPNKKFDMIIIFGIILLLVYLLKMGLNFFIQYYGHLMGVAMQADMRSDLFRHIQLLPFSFFDDHETGKIMTRMTSDLFDICELAHHGPENIIISFFTLGLSFSYLLSINVPLSLIIFTIIPILVFIATRIRGAYTSARRRTRVATSIISGQLQTSISGVRVTKAFTNDEKEIEKFEEGNEEFQRASRDSYKAMAKYHSSTAFVIDIFNVVVLVAGGIFLYGGQINFADYSAFVVSISLFITPINRLIGFMEQFQNGVTGFERFCEIMDIEVEKDSENAIELKEVKGKITLENVSYGYSEDTEVLKGISLTINPGQKFALVGPSGGGKTTICHLIPRFYEIMEGKIFIDDNEVREVTRESLRRNIGIVQQDVFLFNDTIKNNILYGKLDATDQEVVEAAKRANIHEYIETLPEGYDTQIGERGVKLSGGQKQRLSIARVFLKNPAILILDEATSALDNVTELMIQKSLDELCEGRTTLVVAHRLSTIQNADEIAVVDKGQIIEQGSHDTLIKNNGAYAKLYSQQLK
ncbi:MAG: ABC transporter ATP-binding protein [Bacillota bacterium]|jgi:ATP-binding cassette subfamily B protein|nr:ABC transporter ATP-binding protein [Bacillota bacterium]NLL27103.1 ABC transporter ATP-binding protein [Erysipelotrichia bacterium]